MIARKGKFEYWLTDEGLLLIAGWARDGLTDEQIAQNMGISRSTLAKWKTEYSDISDTLKESKEIADRHVENALYKRAIGYSYKETTQELKGDELVVTKIVEKEIAPDTTAQIYWLKNRKRKDWQDRPQEPDTQEEIVNGVNQILVTIKEAAAKRGEHETD